MKLTKHFDNFLSETVNLNQSRIETLESRIKTISNFLRESDFKAPIIKFTAQGSWAHKTIIKPAKDNKEFDADIVVFVKPVNNWSAKDYILDLRSVFLENKTYEKIASMKTRCVTLDYSGDFHLDIVPILCTEKTIFDEKQYDICNRTENKFERTDGEGFADWLKGENNVIKNNNLKKVVRLLKFLRDNKETFSAKSILLTTLIGNQVYPADSVFNPDSFADVPTTLKTIVNRLYTWLENRPQLPDIQNPVLP